MNSRMERYIEKEEEQILSRTDKNKELYNSVQNLELSNIKTSNNVKVIESSDKNIDIDKIKKYITALNEEKPIRRKTIVLDDYEFNKPETTEEDTREYDIHSFLEKAKQEREIDYDKERYKKLRDTQFDILSKINTFTKEESTPEPEFNTDEKTLIDLINTITIHKSETGLLDELKDELSNTKILPIKEEQQNNSLKEEIKTVIEEKQKEIEKTQELVELKSKQIDEKNNLNNIDKSFYTNSMSFSKEDFEGFEGLEKTVKKNNTLVIISLVVLFVAIGITLLVIANYVFDLNLF